VQKLVSANRQKKSSVGEQLTECWTTVVNPFSTTLHILENIHEFEIGKSNAQTYRQILQTTFKFASRLFLRVYMPHCTVRNSLKYCLMMACVSGKKLLMTILKAFDHWCSDSAADKRSFLDHSIQLQAFAIIVRDAVPFPHGVDIIVRCFQLDQLTDPHDCLVLIRQLLDKKDFYKVHCMALMHQLHCRITSK